MPEEFVEIALVRLQPTDIAGKSYKRHRRYAHFTQVGFFLRAVDQTKENGFISIVQFFANSEIVHE